MAFGRGTAALWAIPNLWAPWLLRSRILPGRFPAHRPKQHRRFLRIEQGTYQNGAFQFQRILNGDQTDGGMDFSSEPLVLRVSVTSY